MSELHGSLKRSEVDSMNRLRVEALRERDEALDKLALADAEIARLRKLIEHISLDRQHLSRKNESLVRRLANIYAFLKPPDAVDPDGTHYEYHPPDPVVRRSWDGLSKAIRDLEEEPSIGRPEWMKP